MLTCERNSFKLDIKLIWSLLLVHFHTNSCNINANLQSDGNTTESLAVTGNLLNEVGARKQKAELLLQSLVTTAYSR